MQGRRKLLSPVWQGGGTPRYFCNCSFQEGLSPMILQVRIAWGLGRHFFASAHCKGLAETFFGCAHSKGLAGVDLSKGVMG